MIEMVFSKRFRLMSVHFTRPEISEKFLSYSPSEWLLQRPQRLVGLDESPESTIKLAHIIETMYSSMNKQLVLTWSFRHNIVAYSFSHSRQLIDYLNSLIPGGSYNTLTNWITDQGSDPIVFPPGDVRVVFDNQKVISKRWTPNRTPSTQIYN